MVPLPAVYGSIHAVAWNKHFPTPTERLLWRFSATYIGGTTLAVLPLCCAIVLVGRHKRNNPARRRSWPRLKRMAEAMETKTSEVSGWELARKVLFHIAWAFGGLVYFVLWTAILVVVVCMLSGVSLSYIFSRVYLVVEAFISLRSLPKGAFETVRWMDYWPHFLRCFMYGSWTNWYCIWTGGY